MPSDPLAPAETGVRALPRVATIVSIHDPARSCANCWLEAALRRQAHRVRALNRAANRKQQQHANRWGQQHVNRRQPQPQHINLAHYLDLATDIIQNLTQAEFTACVEWGCEQAGVGAQTAPDASTAREPEAPTRPGEGRPLLTVIQERGQVLDRRVGVQEE